METWEAWILIIVAFISSFFVLIYQKLWEKNEKKLKDKIEENEQLKHQNKKLKYENQCLAKQLHRFKQNSLSSDIEDMACILRKVSCDCVGCEYLAEDGSCQKPIDCFCNVDEDILTTCDTLCNAGYSHNG